MKSALYVGTRDARAPLAARPRLPLPGLHGAPRSRRAAAPRPAPAPVRLEPARGDELPRRGPHRRPRDSRRARRRPRRRRLDPGADEPARARLRVQPGLVLVVPARGRLARVHRGRGEQHVRRAAFLRALARRRAARPTGASSSRPTSGCTSPRSCRWTRPTPGGSPIRRRPAQRAHGRPRGRQPRLPRHADGPPASAHGRLAAVGPRPLSPDARPGARADPLAGAPALAEADAASTASRRSCPGRARRSGEDRRRRRAPPRLPGALRARGRRGRPALSRTVAAAASGTRTARRSRSSSGVPTPSGASSERAPASASASRTSTATGTATTSSGCSR